MAVRCPILFDRCRSARTLPVNEASACSSATTLIDGDDVGGADVNVDDVDADNSDVVCEDDSGVALTSGTVDWVPRTAVNIDHVLVATSNK
jgi:hypothetical protein